MSAIAFLYYNCMVGFFRSFEILSRVDVPFVLTPIVPMLHFVTLYIFVILVIHKDTILKHKFTFFCWLMMFNIVCVCLYMYTPFSEVSLTISFSYSKRIVCFTMEC